MIAQEDRTSIASAVCGAPCVRGSKALYRNLSRGGHERDVTGERTLVKKAREDGGIRASDESVSENTHFKRRNKEASCGVAIEVFARTTVSSRCASC